MRMGQRTVALAGFVVCAGLMATAVIYFQNVLGLEPCPLCILQRVAVIAIGVVLLLAGLHNPRVVGRRVYGALIVVAAGFGLAVAGRNVWLQHLPPDQVPACGPGLDYMLQAFPLNKTIQMVFHGSGECAEIKWTFLSFSIPEWMLLFFTGFLLLGLILLFSRRLFARA